MAFTSTQKAQIHFYTGWSARWHQVDSDLERAILAVEGDAAVELLITTAVAACVGIDAKLVDAHGRLKALKVGSIDLPGRLEIAELEKQGRMHAGRIASTLGVEIRHDVFSASRPQGRSASGYYEKHG